MLSKVHAELDLGAALRDTGVAIVTEEVPTSNFVRRNPSVYFTTSVSVVYANVGDLLVAYATDISSGEPASDVVISLNATNTGVRAILAPRHLFCGAALHTFASVQHEATALHSLLPCLFVQGNTLFSGTVTTGPDGAASATLTFAEVEDDYNSYDVPLSLTAVAPSGGVVLAQLENLEFFNPDPAPFAQATVRTDHSAAAPGATRCLLPLRPDIEMLRAAEDAVTWQVTWQVTYVCAAPPGWFSTQLTSHACMQARL